MLVLFFPIFYLSLLLLYFILVVALDFSTTPFGSIIGNFHSIVIPVTMAIEFLRQVQSSGASSNIDKFLTPERMKQHPWNFDPDAPQQNTSNSPATIPSSGSSSNLSLSSAAVAAVPPTTSSTVPTTTSPVPGRTYSSSLSVPVSAGNNYNNSNNASYNNDSDDGDEESFL